MKILFYDRDEEYRKRFEKLLTLLGHEVICTSDKPILVSAAKSDIYDLIITDYKLANKKADLETIATLRGFDASTPILVLHTLPMNKPAINACIRFAPQ